MRTRYYRALQHRLPAEACWLIAQVVMTARSTTTNVKGVSKMTTTMALALLNTHYKYLLQRNVIDREQSVHHYFVAYQCHAVDMLKGN